MADALTWADLQKMGAVPGTTGNDSLRAVSWDDLQKAGAVDASTIGTGESVARGGAQGLTAKFGDEITGAIQAAPRLARALSPAGFLLEPLQRLADATSGVPESQLEHARQIDAEKAARPDAPGFFPRYRMERDAERAANERAKAAHSTAYGGGELAGMVLGSPMPGGGLAKAVGTGLGMGALTGLGGSKADLTKGEVGDALLDTAAGGVAGATGGALGYGAGKLLGKAVEKASAGIRKAQADAAQKANDAAQQVFRTARSSLGGETTAALQQIAKAEEIAANVAGKYRPDQAVAAAKWLADPEVAAIRQAAADNLLELGPGRLAGSLQSARNVFSDATKGIQPQAVEAAGEAMLRNPVATQAIPRLKTALSRGIPIAVGSAIGGPAGTVAGSAVAAVSGRPGTALANAMKHPATRNALWRAVGGAAGAGKKTAEVGIPAAQRALTQDEVEALLEALRGNDAP